MAGSRTIKIKFDGDVKGLQRAAGQASGAMSKWGAKTQALGVAAGIGIAAAGRALFQFARDSIGEFAAAQEAQTRLQDAFARFPRIADTNIDRLRALNTALASKTRFDDDAFASGQAVLAQFGLTGKQLENITPLLADYAAKTGQDLPGAAEALGKSFLGNTRALKALGINYKSTGDKAKDIANITQLVRDKVGGFAEKEGKTASGQAAILGNKFGELKETVGQKLLPVMMKLAEIGLKVVDWISQNQKIVGPLVAVIGAVVIAQWAWNVAMTGNPIGLIIVGVALLVAGIVFLATKTKFFQGLWGATWGGIKAVAFAVGRWFRDTLWHGWIEPAWKGVIGAGTKALDWFKSLPGKLRTAFSVVTAIITAPWRAAFNAIARLWNSTVGRLSFSIPGWVPGLGGKGFSMPNLPTMHTGGVVPGRGDVLSVLRGGEGVFTADQMAALGGPRVIENHIHIGDEVVRVVRTEISNSGRGLRRRVLAGAGAR